MGKVDEKLVKAALKKLGLKAGKDAPEALRAHFREHGNETEGDPHELVQCGSCGEPSFSEFTTCPFCGAGEAAPSAVAGGAPPAGEAPGAEEEVVPAASLVRDDLKPSSEVQTTSKLDEAVTEVHRLKGDTAGAYWELGLKVAEIYDSKLWQLRVDDKGKVKWKGFDAFCHHELGFEPRQAYKLMDGSRKFSRDQAVAIGRKKLQLIAAAPEEDQPALVRKAEEGATVREMISEVQKIKQEKGHVRPSRGAGAGAGVVRKSKDKPAPEKPAAERITVATAAGKVVVKLHAATKMTPKQKRGEDLAEAPYAKRLADGPLGREELSNGVVVVYRVVEGRKGLELHVTRERAEG
jgi:hypothetical protein